MGKKEDKIFKPLPCYKNDILAIEAWLEEMAAEGYMPKKFKNYGVVFTAQTPAKVRYRLLVEPKSGAMDTVDHLAKDAPTPADNYIALQEQNGWRYIAKYNKFLLFMAADSAVPEPKRDVCAAVSQAKRHLLWEIAPIVLISAALFLWMYVEGILGLLVFVKSSSWYILILAVVWLTALFSAFWTNHRINNLCSAYGGHVSQPDWRDTAQAYQTRHRLMHILSNGLLIVILLIMLPIPWGEGEVPLEEYPDPIPFPLIQDIVAPELQAQCSYHTYVVHEQDLLAPVMLEVTQRGRIAFGEDSYYGTILDIEYYQTVAPWVATQIAKEFFKYDRATFYYHDSVIHEKMLSVQGAAYAAAYEMLSATVVVLAQDSEVIRILIYDINDFGGLSVEDIAQRYADALWGV